MSMNLPRRPTPVTRWPAMRPPSASALTGSTIFTASPKKVAPVKVRPTIKARSPLAMVCTSGPSGIGNLLKGYETRIVTQAAASCGGRRLRAILLRSRGIAWLYPYKAHAGYEHFSMAIAWISSV